MDMITRPGTPGLAAAGSALMTVLNSGRNLSSTDDPVQAWMRPVPGKTRS